MKKLLAAASVLALTSTAALAQSLSANDAEIIRALVPDAQLTELSGEQIEALSVTAAGTDVLRDPAAPERIRAILAGDMTGYMADARPMMLTASEAEELAMLMPGVDPTTVTADQAQQISTLLSAPDYARGAEAEAFVAEVLMGGGHETGMTSLSSLDAERVRGIVPDADLSMLDADQARQLSDFVNSDDYRTNPSAAEFIRSVLRG